MSNPWIKMTNRLPTEEDAPSSRVLVHFANGWKESEYDNWGVRSPAFKGWQERLKDNNFEPIYPDYWMPIPELPK